MTHVTCRLIAKNWDQLWNPMLDNRVWATFTFSGMTVFALLLTLSAECQQPLVAGSFYSRGNAHYCVDDYHRLYGTRCDVCGEYVEGEVITALGKTYHDQCFHCSRCR